MISSHYITSSSSWREGTPSSLSSAITVLFDDDNTSESGDNFQEGHVQQTSHVELKPQDDGACGTPVTVVLRCENNVNITSIVVVSNARHMEVYDDRGEYTCTVRGEKLTEVESQAVTYKKVSPFEKSLSSCSLKFLSLAEKKCLKLLRLVVTVSRVAQDELILPKKQIDMVKVRELLSDMSHPIPENVEHLMQTVEQYQENQSSVWNDIQQRAQDSASRNSSVGPMAGMLSALSRASELSRMSSPHSEGLSTDSNALTEAMSKMMTSFSGRHGNPPSADNELYSSLLGICKNVSQMRQNETRRTKNDESEKSEKEASGTEKHGPSINGTERLAEMLQETMVTQLQEMEERMMRSLEKRLDGFEKLLELRLNRMEVIVEQLASSHRNTQSQQSEGQHGYHGD